MHRLRRPLRLSRETIRQLTAQELGAAAGGARKTTSSDADGELCPIDWSYYCVP